MRLLRWRWSGWVAEAMPATGIAGSLNSWAHDRLHLHTKEAAIVEGLRDGGLEIDDRSRFSAR